jgi:hypothetical protein
MSFYMLRAGLLLIMRTSSQSTQRMTVPVAVYTELILLMMSSKPTRNIQKLIIEIN